MQGLLTKNFIKSTQLCKVFSASLSHHSSSCVTAKPLKVLVTGAAGQIGYSILPRLARGDVWGKDQSVVLKMFDIPQTESIMHGVRMELEDCSFKALKSVEVHTDPKAAFADSDVIIMLANIGNLTATMKRAELLQENAKIYHMTAEMIKQTCHKDVKVLMIANPANTNCLLLAESLSGVVSPKNFTSLTRLDHNRTHSFVAQKLGVSNDKIRKVIVWGNHSSTMYPDLRYAEVSTPEGWVKVTTLIKDKDWIETFLVPTTRERAFSVISARGKSSSLSAANASIDHLRSWLVGTEQDDWVSMGVYVDQAPYEGIPTGLVFGLPCTCYKGSYEVVRGLNIDPHTRSMITTTTKELLDERAVVM